MRNHVKIYLNYFGYGPEDFVPCEVCESKAVDIHHIDCKGMGGSKAKDYIENLQALCRSCHIDYGDKKECKEYLTKIHLLRMKHHENISH